MRKIPEVTFEELKSGIEKVYDFTNVFSIDTIFDDKEILERAIAKISDEQLKKINNFSVLTQDMIDNTSPEAKVYISSAKVGDLVWNDGAANSAMQSVMVWVEQYKCSIQRDKFKQIEYVADAVAMNLIYKTLVKFNSEK